MAGFEAGEYILPAARLRPLQKIEAQDLGARLARIDPWKNLGFSASVLAGAVLPDPPTRRRFGIEIGDRVAGVVGIMPVWLRGPYLELLGILPEFQGTGTGSAILHWMESEAIATRDRNLWTCVSAPNRDALRFYEANGFRPQTRLEGLVVTGEDEILMRKSLPEPS